MAGAFIVFIMLLFPPFCMKYGEGVIINGGYSFILAPQDKESVVNEIQLLVQWFGVLILTAMVFLVVKSSDKS